MSFAEAGSTNLSPGEKTREVDYALVSRQRAVALALLRVPLLHCAILLSGEQYDTSAAVKHQRHACTAFNAEHRKRCLAEDHSSPYSKRAARRSGPTSPEIREQMLLLV